MTGQHRIVVLGAGYAGLSAARRLAKKARGAQVTVVDARAQFIERVRLHQRVAGQPLR
ncbi:FAD-dependent oxidoreductase, partial [Nocardia farcinica]